MISFQTSNFLESVLTYLALALIISFHFINSNLSKKIKEIIAYKINGKKEFDSVDLEAVTRWGLYLGLFIIEIAIVIVLFDL